MPQTKPFPGFVTIPGLRWEAAQYRKRADRASGNRRAAAIVLAGYYRDFANEKESWEYAVADMAAMDAFAGGDGSNSVWS